VLQSLQPTTLKFEIRPAQTGDIGSLTELHMATFKAEKNIPVLLGRRYVRATYRWLVTSRQAFTLFAEAQDKIVGLVAISDGSFAGPMFRACLREFFWSLVLSPLLLFKRRLWQRLIGNDRYITKVGREIANYPGLAQVVIVMVDKEFRRRGVFSALIEAAKDVSRSRGGRAIRAGIYKENWPSRRAFRYAGWRETPELETNKLVFYVASCAKPPRGPQRALRE